MVEKIDGASKIMRNKSPRQIKNDQRRFMSLVVSQAKLLVAHQNAVCALKTAGLLCQHMLATKTMNEHDNQCYTTFLVKLHTALTTLVQNKNMIDLRVLDLLPNGSMVRAFEKMKVRRMSEFLATPLSQMVSVAGMKLPLYIQYMHPEFVPPPTKRKSHKARK